MEFYHKTSNFQCNKALHNLVLKVVRYKCAKLKGLCTNYRTTDTKHTDTVLLVLLFMPQKPFCYCNLRHLLFCTFTCFYKRLYIQGTGYTSILAFSGNRTHDLYICNVICNVGYTCKFVE